MGVKVGIPGILPGPEPTMMGALDEFLEKIVWFCSAPINGSTPASLPSYSAIKQLSLVNRRLRAICVHKRLHHFRIHVPEELLDIVAQDLRQNHMDFLRAATWGFLLMTY